VVPGRRHKCLANHAGERPCSHARQGSFRRGRC
jgi:hypothetical protein